ncbi:MAG: hypothetical protein FWC87_16070, partial [Acidimicrobiaceae bacterium]|nr:hypothetical protein [Acidimicrobiaceae bacterium]
LPVRHRDPSLPTVSRWSFRSLGGRRPGAAAVPGSIAGPSPAPVGTPAWGSQTPSAPTNPTVESATPPSAGSTEPTLPVVSTLPLSAPPDGATPGTASAGVPYAAVPDTAKADTGNSESGDFDGTAPGDVQPVQTFRRILSAEPNPPEPPDVAAPTASELGLPRLHLPVISRQIGAHEAMMVAEPGPLTRPAVPATPTSPIDDPEPAVAVPPSEAGGTLEPEVRGLIGADAPAPGSPEPPAPSTEEITGASPPSLPGPSRRVQRLRLGEALPQPSGPAANLSGPPSPTGTPAQPPAPAHLPNVLRVPSTESPASPVRRVPEQAEDAPPVVDPPSAVPGGSAPELPIIARSTSDPVAPTLQPVPAVGDAALLPLVGDGPGVADAWSAPAGVEPPPAAAPGADPPGSSPTVGGPGFTSDPGLPVVSRSAVVPRAGSGAAPSGHPGSAAGPLGPTGVDPARPPITESTPASVAPRATDDPTATEADTNAPGAADGAPSPDGSDVSPEPVSPEPVVLPLLGEPPVLQLFPETPLVPPSEPAAAEAGASPTGAAGGESPASPQVAEPAGLLPVESFHAATGRVQRLSWVMPGAGTQGAGSTFGPMTPSDPIAHVGAAARATGFDAGAGRGEPAASVVPAAGGRGQGLSGQAIAQPYPMRGAAPSRFPPPPTLSTGPAATRGDGAGPVVSRVVHDLPSGAIAPLLVAGRPFTPLPSAEGEAGATPPRLPSPPAQPAAGETSVQRVSSSWPESFVMQRDEAAAGAPASDPVSPTTPAPSNAAPQNVRSDGDLDDLGRRLYDGIRDRLKAELYLDRERAGLLTDLNT